MFARRGKTRAVTPGKEKGGWTRRVVSVDPRAVLKSGLFPDARPVRRYRWADDAAPARWVRAPRRRRAQGAGAGAAERARPTGGAAHVSHQPLRLPLDLARPGLGSRGRSPAVELRLDGAH